MAKLKDGGRIFCVMGFLTKQLPLIERASLELGIPLEVCFRYALDKALSELQTKESKKKNR